MAWDRSVDVLVVGSGAGGLLAGLVAADRGADVLIVEKSELFGGTSATSGGGIWIPDSHLARAAGAQDSADEAFTYVRQLSAANIDDAFIRAYVDTAATMLKWLEDNTPVRYASVPYTDYHAELAGGKLGYRTHLPLALDGRPLGAEINRMRTASPSASLGGLINWSFDETYALLFRPKGWIGKLSRMLWRYVSDVPQRLRSTRDRHLTLGTALVGGLRMALNRLNVPLWLESPLVELVREGDRLIGAVVRHDGHIVRIEARRGVVLAAGGFERNADKRRQYLRASPDPQRSGSQINNVGEAIDAATAIGAATKNLQSTWSAPVFYTPGDDRARLSAVERSLPGAIIVNQAGKRYMNEAASYHMAGRAMLAANRPGAETDPSWFVFDADFRRRYPAGPLFPIIPDWLHLKGIRSMLHKARTPAELARSIGVPAEAFEATIARFNAGARIGTDDEFGRGAAAYDRMYGDQRVTPNPTLAPLDRAPFYALPIYAGDIGTNGGLVTDETARVIDTAGKAIIGLYAVGNNSASVMGESYPGAGSTLGPALTFAYVAGRHLMGAND